MMPTGSSKGSQAATNPKEQTPRPCADKTVKVCKRYRKPPSPSRKFRTHFAMSVTLSKRHLTRKTHAKPLTSPRNDVNRRFNVARGLGTHQPNIALDSAFVEKESLGPLKSQDFCAASQHPHKKSAPHQDALEISIQFSLRKNRSLANRFDARGQTGHFA